MELNQVGKNEYEYIEPTIIMGIKAPRGQMFLFEQPLYHRYTDQTVLNKQCKAIRAFMEEHRNDY